MSGPAPDSPRLPAASPEPPPLSAELARTDARLRLAKGLLHMRRLRLKLFNPDYFGEAAFDMLLDLYVCFRQGRTVYQNDAYIASLVPAATAHRWLLALKRDGLVMLACDQSDRRRSIVQLTEAGRARIEALFDGWLDIRAAVVDGPSLTPGPRGA